MTGKKRIRYEQIPYFWTEFFDLKLDFVGDFSIAPTRVDLRGTYAKKKFIRATTWATSFARSCSVMKASATWTRRRRNCAQRSENNRKARDQSLPGICSSRLLT